MSITKIFHFLKLSLYKIVVVATPDRTDAPNSKEYFQVQISFIKIR